MRLLFDIPRLSERPLGMQVYIEHVLEAILESAPPKWQFNVHTMGLRGMDSHRQRLQTIDRHSRAKRSELLLPQRMYEYLLDTQACRLLRNLFPADIIHSFGWRKLPPSKARLVLTIQDVIPIRLSEGDPQFVERIRTILTQLARRADKIITISEFSKSEIIDILGAQPEKIDVIPDGVDRDWFKPLAESEVTRAKDCLTRLCIPSPYLLHIGGAAKRKNRINLIKAFEILKERYKVPHSLVFAGSALDSECTQLVAAAGCKDQILSIGYLTRTDALHVLQQADALVFPSTYEGFGLPPLEAMSCNVPVAMSNAASLPEVGGSAAVYFDPHSPEEMSAAVWQIVSRPEVRRTCIDAGVARSREFTWQNNAARTIAIYKKFSHVN